MNFWTPFRRAYRRRVVWVCAHVLVIVASGCHQWVPAELGTANTFLSGRARLHRTDGASVIVVGPRIVGDSVVGRVPNTSASVSTARADVQRIEVERVARGRTALVGVGIVAVYLLAASAFSDSPK